MLEDRHNCNTVSKMVDYVPMHLLVMMEAALNIDLKRNKNIVLCRFGAF